MAYRLEQLEALPAVVDEQLAEVERAIEEQDLHRLRKATKRLRALLALVAPELGRKRARKDDRLLRDLSRLAAHGRDAEVVVALLDEVAPHLGAPVEDVEVLRRELRADAEEARAGWDPEDATARLERLRRRTRRWAVTEASALDGARRTLARCRKRMRAAERDRSSAPLHQWRKDVKRHWHHVELLGDPARAERAHRVADRLGDDHDLAVLAERAPELAGLAEEVARRRAQLQEEAFDLGEELFSTRPRLAAAQLVAGLPVP